MDYFLGKIQEKVRWNIQHHRWQISGFGQKQEHDLLYFSFQAEPWPGHIVFPLGPPPWCNGNQTRETQTLWRPDCDVEDSWEWGTAAENKLAFDSISLLMFDICSTIKFHGKIRFVKASQFVAALASPPPKTLDYTSLSSLVSDEDVQMDEGIYCGWFSFLTLTGVNWGRVLSGGWKRWRGFHGSALSLLQCVVLLSRLCRKRNDLITGAAIKNSISLAAAAWRRGVNLVRLLHLRPKKER